MEEKDKFTIVKMGCACAPFVPLSYIPYAPSLIAGGATLISSFNAPDKVERHGQPFTMTELKMLMILDTVRLAMTIGAATDLLKMTQFFANKNVDTVLLIGAGVIGLIESIKVMSRAITFDEILE